MQEPKSNHAPYRQLGNRLKQVRESRRETIAEAAGAVEIDVMALKKIEAGSQRPSEDILMLLIDHFELVDQEAVNLWESAGYERPDAPADASMKDIAKNAAFVVLAVDTRTQYTDGVEINANASGLTMQFNQSGPNGPQPVSRLGMSYAQAEQVMKALEQTLLYQKYGSSRKGLPSPKSDEPNNG